MGNGTVRTVHISRQLGFDAITPKVLVCYNLVEGVTNKEEAMLLAADESLQPLGTIDWSAITMDPVLTESEFLERVFQYTPGYSAIDEIPVHENMKLMDVVQWKLKDDEQLRLLNVATEDEPKHLGISSQLSPILAQCVEQLFLEYKDVIAWSYTDLKGIPEELATYRIELDTTIPWPINIDTT
jgi:hypothetical protein